MKTKKIKVICVAAARPNFMKIAPDLWQKIKKFTRIYNIETEINLKKLEVE